MQRFVAHKVKEMTPSGIRAFFDLVLGMKDVISLGVGEPDFVTPWKIRESAIFSLEEGYTSYTSNKGLVKLRLALKRHLNNKFNLDYDHEEEMVITVGVSEAFDLAVRALLNSGDEVIVPQPSYVSYAPLAELAGGTAVLLDTKNTGFKMLPKDIEKKCTKKTKALIINYPSNPTGVTYSKKELQGIARVAEKHNLCVISDEIYDDLTYDFSHMPLATLPGMKERVLYLNGFSKGYAMTGWRIGYACGNKDIIAAMVKIHQYTIMCAPIMSQMAACEALQTGRPAVEEMKREYLRRRNFVATRLEEIGLECTKPEGAFYVFPSIKKTGLSSMEFASRLLKDYKVAVVPGTAFGKDYEGYIRMSYATSFEKLKEALVRMETLVRSR